MSLEAENPNEYKITEVSRFEVIDESGRSYTNLDVDSIILSMQDDGRTLKVFIDEKKLKPR